MDEYGYRDHDGDVWRDRTAHVVIWTLCNLPGLALAVTALVANAWLYGPQTSLWTSAWATGVVACGAYWFVDRAPVLRTSAGTRRTVMDWARERADAVADWAGWEWDEEQGGWV